MRIVFGSLAVLVSVLAVSMPVMPGHIPGDRLIANLTEKLKEQPNNAQIYYLIGRAHFATFASAVETQRLPKGEIEYYDGRDGLPKLNSIRGSIYPWNSKTAVEDTSENLRHVSAAISHLRIAIEMVENQKVSTTGEVDLSVAYLTYGCTFEAGALLAPKIKLEAPDGHLSSKEQWRDKAASCYLMSYKKAIWKNSKEREKPLFGIQQMISYEAGRAYLRLAPNSQEAKAVQAGVKRLENLPDCQDVTPIILDLSEAKHLDALLMPSKRVGFDLDGSGRDQTYGWVKPTTAFLVWNPLNEGRVSSGRQLFGNATWWMLWDNGYAAMDALDNNRDGWLAGKELAGLALWYDTNVNGKSDRGEVVPIAHTSVSKLRTSFDEFIGSSMVSREGVVLKGGRSLPTYDWVTSPVSK